MKRILLTGLSGTGKSTVVGALGARGYKAVDLDCDEFSEWTDAANYKDLSGTPVEPDRDWIWREDRVQELLSLDDVDVLFVSGCAPNMKKFLHQFDHVILLTAPTEVIVERLRTRVNNDYGKKEGQISRVLALIKDVEPLLRKFSALEIDTNVRLDKIVAMVLAEYHKDKGIDH